MAAGHLINFVRSGFLSFSFSYAKLGVQREQEIAI